MLQKVECIYFLLQLCACLLHDECSLSEIEQHFVWYVLAQQFYPDLLIYLFICIGVFFCTLVVSPSDSELLLQLTS